MKKFRVTFRVNSPVEFSVVVEAASEAGATAKAIKDGGPVEGEYVSLTLVSPTTADIVSIERVEYH